jgi:3'-phosphoadenosine 5'-phosphosulfate sulfotransferase (PAPS reductase)/FAD synthetase
MTDPFRIDGPTCISFSGGRTSALTLHKLLRANGGLPNEAQVLFCNTGKEEEATLRFVRECGERWSVPITWLEYQGDGGFTVTDLTGASRNGEPFEAIIAQRGGVLPNRVARYCSSEMKTRTMHRYLRSIGWTEWDTVIGIRADEPRRVAKFRANPHPETKAEEVHMPLAVAGVGAQDVGAFWRQQPFDLELPNMNGKTMHGNCDLCYLKPAHQVFSLIAEKPSRAVWWAAQEKKAESTTNGSACRFRDDRPSYAQMAQYAADQRDAFGHPEEEAISCFCGD